MQLVAPRKTGTKLFVKTQKKYRLRLYLTIIFCTVACSVAHAQFDAQLTQYIYNRTVINPAVVGEQQMVQISALQRLQWISIDNAPRTTFVSVHSPVKIGKTKHGVGVQFVNDIFGIFSNQQINLQYAYKLKLGDGVLSIGANIGVSNVKVKGDSVKLVESDYHVKDDDAVPTSEVLGVAFDCGLGISYSTERWHVGIAALHLPEMNIALGSLNGFYMTRLYTASGSYNFKLKNPDYTIKTSAAVITDFVSWNPSITALLDYKGKYWGGLGGRLDAISFLLGIKVLNGLVVGYAYDLPVNKIITASHGSHEIYLAYEFGLGLNKKGNKHKSVRIL